MSFFKQFPQIEYDLCEDGIISKRYDIFRHVDVTDLRTDDYTTYLYYSIQDGDRPDTISQKLYGSSRYHWTFFIINDFLQEGYNVFYKSYVNFHRGLDLEYGDRGALIFLPPDNILGGVDLETIRMQLVNKTQSPSEYATIVGWNSYMLTLILEDSEVSFFGDNDEYHFAFPSDVTNDQKDVWLASYTQQLKDVGRLAPDVANLVEGDLSSYTYIPTRSYSNMLLAPYRFVAPGDIETRAKEGDLIGAYDALVNGYGSLDADNLTYFEYEYEGNNEKRQIRYVRPNLIERFADEYQSLINR